MQSIVKKILKSFLVFYMTAVIVNAVQGGTWSVQAVEAMSDIQSYYYYMQQYQQTARPEQEISVDVCEFVQIASGDAKRYNNTEESAEGLYIGKEENQITFQFTVPETGLYNMEMTYFPLAESESRIMFGIRIDGVFPYTEAKTCVLSRMYRNEEIKVDEYGNDIRPKAIQVSEWRKQFVSEQSGIGGNLSFYLAKGKHELTLDVEGQPFLLEKLIIRQEPYLLSYQDYASLHMQKGSKDSTDVQIICQAEGNVLQSDASLWPASDRSSPLTRPFSYNEVKINYSGGSRWNAPGQWLEWEIEVPEDGFYQIGVKYKQGYLDGLFSSRKVLVDGEVPFEELSAVRFEYTTEWENKLFGNEYEPYKIYLTKGTHSIVLENVVGDMNTTMDVLRNSIDELNDLYLSIIMITSSDPDPLRDYYLSTLLPNLPGDFKAAAQILFDEAERLVEVVGVKGKETAAFENVAYDLISYAENIGDLTYKSRIDDLKNNISTLSSKMTEYQNQALDIDYLVIQSSDKEMPGTKLSALGWVEFQVKSFAASFKKNKDETKDIRVWVNGGNDQYEILKRMVDEMFTPKTGIDVDLELVSGTLVEATVIGNGPDVSVGVGDEAAINLALRGALQDLGNFEGYQELVDEYVEGSDIPFTLEGRHYGITNTGSYSMMFVRTDVFAQLGIEIPKTWEDVYDVAQVLQRNGMSLGIVPSFQTLLYQKGGEYYNDDLTAVLFDEDVAVEAFEQYTEFYTEYDFPLTFDFVSRFRTGEMPIALSGYSTYNTLKYSAPEIEGLWEMFPIPGMENAAGELDTSNIGAVGTGVVMLANSKNKDEAWEFMKWWSGAEAQERYAKDLEAAMGISARYATLNKAVFDKIGWTRSELAVLKEGMESLCFVPNVPGNYYVGRGVTNTFRGVVYEGENVRELLTDWTLKINEELIRKRNEFFQNN